jgi:organic radical activating enzyme
LLRVSRRAGGAPEIFHSLQGEGVNIGAPAVFLRLALCNLTCAWCDTKYTWDWRNFNYKNEVASLYAGQIRDAVLRFGCPHLIITGGEPMLQQKELAPLVAELKDEGFYVEVETNGTIAPIEEMARDIDQWNVSPKLETSGVQSGKREVPRVLETFRAMPRAYFKFVVVEPSDVEEVCRLRDRYRLPSERIILLPEGTTPSTLQSRSQWVSEACVREGFRFSTRLHILLWGDERGR